VRAAIAQISPALGDLRRNVELHREWIARARGEKADLVLFPELSLTGYELRDLVPEVALDPRRAPELRGLLDDSRGIAIGLGLVEGTDDPFYFNAAAWLEGGEVRHLHRKCYLPTYGMFDEGRYFAAGRSFRAFDAAAGRLGMLVCEDFWHVPSAYLLALDGARALCVLAASPVKCARPGEYEGAGSGHSPQGIWLDLARTTSRLYTQYTLFANRCGSEDRVQYGGGSFVMGPAGEVLAKADPVEEGLIVAEICERETRRARTRWPLLRDERPELVLRELERLLRDERPAPPAAPATPEPERGPAAPSGETSRRAASRAGGHGAAGAQETRPAPRPARRPAARPKPKPRPGPRARRSRR